MAQSSSKPRAFSKYQGLGNDFLIIDLRDSDEGPSPDASDDSGFFRARKLCDRRLGVGGDGVLTLTAPTSPGAVATMRVLNADGSEAEMCGNGLRCVAKHLLLLEKAANTGAADTSAITVDTGAGPLLCQAHWEGKLLTSVTVSMGSPKLSRGKIPMLGPADDRCLEEEYSIAGRTLKLSAVSMGNPHAIAFVPEAGAALMKLAENLGPALETHDDFPMRTNAEFAHVHSRDAIELVVWERGVGITQACGTGACATAVAACLAGMSDCERDITVTLPGGALSIRVASDYSQVLMRGPAEHVFDGSLDLDAL